ncbi:MAG: gamma-glutamyltransferase [Adhaeribacter sp.]|nr:gamma-glutamyltransferase [Adhaeribacter sp.]
MRPQQLSVKAQQGAVVSIDEYASKAGVQVLKQGGNAVDAAIATAFALAVTHPFAGNLGGGGFMLIRLASGEEVALDFREMAPARATADMFLKADGTVDYELSNFGYLVAGVPGTVKGLEAAWRKFGSLPWANLIQPAIDLAHHGIYLNAYDAASLVRHQKDLARFPETIKTFFKLDGFPYGTSDLFRQPNLAATLAGIAQGGAAWFYEGEMADRFIADVQANGGIINKADLKDYEVKFREPIKGTFGGYEILGMPLPSAGGVGVQQMLNVLKYLNLDEHNPLEVPNLHLLLETMRYVFLDRATYLGDTDFGKVPVAELLSEGHAAAIAAKIDRQRATPSQLLFEDVQVNNENLETTHFSVIDKQGNLVSATLTLEEAFGSKAVVKGLGFLLNCEMHDFNINPRQVNFQGITPANPNGIAPHKRMLSSMTPTVVLKDGKPFLVTGSPGGRSILNVVLQVILATTLYKLPLQRALALPRLSHHWMPDVVYLEKGRWEAETVQALASQGHSVAEVDFLGDAHSIFIDPVTGLYEAEADTRRAGWAEGY